MGDQKVSRLENDRPARCRLPRPPTVAESRGGFADGINRDSSASLSLKFRLGRHLMNIVESIHFYIEFVATTKFGISQHRLQDDVVDQAHRALTASKSRVLARLWFLERQHFDRAAQDSAFSTINILHFEQRVGICE